VSEGVLGDRSKDPHTLNLWNKWI